MCIRDRSAVWAQDSTRLIGEEYLLNAKRSSLEMGMPMGVFHYSSSIGVKGCLSNRILKEENAEEHGETIKLPKYLPLKESLGSVIRSRRSVREMGKTPLTMEQLSSLLYYGDGPSGRFDFNTFNNMPPTATLGEEYIGTVRCLSLIHIYVLEQGRITASGSAQELLSDSTIQEAYLGKKKA